MQIRFICTHLLNSLSLKVPVAQISKLFQFHSKPNLQFCICSIFLSTVRALYIFCFISVQPYILNLNFPRVFSSSYVHPSFVFFCLSNFRGSFQKKDKNEVQIHGHKSLLVKFHWWCGIIMCVLHMFNNKWQIAYSK